jgi:hypothetical protein
MMGTAGERRVDNPVPLAADVDEDDTTTVEAGPPAARAPAASEHDEEDRTVQQMVAAPPAIGSARPASSPALGPSSLPAQPSSAAVPSRPPLGRPPAATSARGGAAVVGGVDDLTDDAEPIEDSITAMAPRVNTAAYLDPTLPGRGLPISIPGSVEIRSVEHDELLDETEVRTRPGLTPLDIPAGLRTPGPVHAASQPPPPPRPAAGRPASSARVAVAHVSGGPGALLSEAIDEPPTRPGVEGADELATRPGVEGLAEPPTRPGVADPETHPGLGASASTDDEDDEDDEGVTTRGPAAPPYDGDSVTALAPAVPPSRIEAALKASSGPLSLDDTAGSTTKKVKTSRPPAMSSPADGEVESITTQAPGPLTNILRVLAADSNADLDDGSVARLAEDDEPLENRTAVMANAPLQQVISELASVSGLPPIRPTGGPLQYGPRGVAAPNLVPSSESGLRARSPSGSDERGSLGMRAFGGDAHASGVARAALASDGSVGLPLDPRPHTGAELAFLHGQHAGQSGFHEVDPGKGPRYGLLVGVVALISVLVPITLYFFLQRGADDAVPNVPAELEPGLEGHDPPRAKAVRGRNGLMTPSSAAPASASVAPSSAPSSASPLRR